MYALSTRLDRALKACERDGLRVLRAPGCASRGQGSMGRVETVTNHHTGTSQRALGEYPSLGVVENGREDLRGLLAQLGLGRSGTVYWIGSGIAYHAGVSTKTDYTNPHAVGIEWENSGTAGDPFPERQLQAGAVLNFHLLDEFDLDTPDDARGHKETCYPAGRKVDPRFDMGDFRGRVRSAGKPKASPASVAARKANPDRGPFGPWPFGPNVLLSPDAGDSRSWVSGAEGDREMAVVNAWRRELAPHGEGYFGRPNTPVDGAFVSRMKTWQAAVDLRATGLPGKTDWEVANRR